MAKISTGNSKRSDLNDLLQRLAQQESEFLRHQFLAPALPGCDVRVRIAGAICDIKTQPANFHGWGIFQPQSHTEARLVRPASLAERSVYLKLFPQVRLIVCRRIGKIWFGVPAFPAGSPIQIQGITAICLPHEVQMFDQICTRYDGSQFWYEHVDQRGNPMLASYLRESMQSRMDPAELQKKGLSAAQRAAYELNFWELTGREHLQKETPDQISTETDSNQASDSVTNRLQQRLRDSLSHAGAELIDYLEREDSCRVTFSVAGQRYTSSVANDDLSVQIAGICLNGHDNEFDLSSLVGVLREGQEQDAIYREY